VMKPSSEVVAWLTSNGISATSTRPTTHAATTLARLRAM